MLFTLHISFLWSVKLCLVVWVSFWIGDLCQIDVSCHFFQSAVYSLWLISYQEAISPPELLFLSPHNARLRDGYLSAVGSRLRVFVSPTNIYTRITKEIWNCSIIAKGTSAINSHFHRSDREEWQDYFCRVKEYKWCGVCTYVCIARQHTSYFHTRELPPKTESIAFPWIGTHANADVSLSFLRWDSPTQNNIAIGKDLESTDSWKLSV
jgi:hypothetical protein